MPSYWRVDFLSDERASLRLLSFCKMPRYAAYLRRYGHVIKAAYTTSPRLICRATSTTATARPFICHCLADCGAVGAGRRRAAARSIDDYPTEVADAARQGLDKDDVANGEHLYGQFLSVGITGLWRTHYTYHFEAAVAAHI